MSRALRGAIGLVGLIVVIGITAGALVAANVDGAVVAWVSVGVGAAWLAFVIWWVQRGPKSERPSSMWW